MNLLRNIAFPLVPIYYLVTALRNKLYDLGIKKSVSYNFPIICVGNLSAGGTGKTPMVEYLINLLKDDYKIATLSRGYKRKSSGFLLASEGVSVEMLGDEPFQFYNKFKDDILVAVDADRNKGIRNLHSLLEKPEIILLDDAYQHRKVKASFNILLTTYNKLYTDDFVLPTGNLREPKGGAKRANIIVVTKCPKDLSNDKKEAIIKRLQPESSQNIFFSHIEYERDLIGIGEKINLEELKRFTLVTGIANPKPLVSFLQEKNLDFEHLNFKDHHTFSSSEIADLSKKDIIVTTEKDFMRLMAYASLNGKLFYLPIKMHIDDSGNFDTLIKEALKF